MPQFDRDTYYEIHTLLVPLTQSADDRTVLFNRAFIGYPKPPIDVRTGTQDIALDRMIMGLVNYGTIDNKQALWILMEYIVEANLVGDDRKKRIEALEPIINGQFASSVTYIPEPSIEVEPITAIPVAPPSEANRRSLTGIISLVVAILGLVVAIIAIPGERWESLGQLVGLGEATETVNPAPTENDAQFYLTRGNEFLDLKQYENALVEYTQAIELDENYAVSYHVRGIAYRNLERYEEAIADFTRAIELDENYAWAYRERGSTYFDLERYEEAIADYTQAIELPGNNDAWAYRERGLAYSELERYEEAIADYTQAIELDRDYAVAYYERGWTYYYSGRYEEAIADFTQAIELPGNNDIWTYNDRGLSYVALERYEEAIADYTQAIELDESYAPAYRYRGDAFYQSGSDYYEQAIADYDTYTELNGSYETYMEARISIMQEALDS